MLAEVEEAMGMVDSLIELGGIPVIIGFLDRLDEKNTEDSTTVNNILGQHSYYSLSLFSLSLSFACVGIYVNMILISKSLIYLN